MQAFYASIKIVRDIVLSVSAIGAAAFYVAPSAERLFVEFFGISAWYWAAEYGVDEAGTARARALNFHHGRIPESIDLCAEACSDEEVVEALREQTSHIVGELVYATISNKTHPVPGRTEPTRTAPQITLVEAFSCHRVRSVDVKKGNPESGYPFNVYFELVRTPCL